MPEKQPSHDSPEVKLNPPSVLNLDKFIGQQRQALGEIRVIKTMDSRWQAALPAALDQLVAMVEENRMRERVDKAEAARKESEQQIKVVAAKQAFEVARLRSVQEINPDRVNQASYEQGRTALEFFLTELLDAEEDEMPAAELADALINHATAIIAKAKQPK